MSLKQNTMAELQRRYDLSSCGIFYADEVHDLSVKGRKNIIAKLARLIAHDHERALISHFAAFTPGYHAGLIRILQRERVELERLLQQAAQDADDAKAGLVAA